LRFLCLRVRRDPTSPYFQTYLVRTRYSRPRKSNLLALNRRARCDICCAYRDRCLVRNTRDKVTHRWARHSRDVVRELGGRVSVPYGEDQMVTLHRFSRLPSLFSTRECYGFERPGPKCGWVSLPSALAPPRVRRLYGRGIRRVPESTSLRAGFRAARGERARCCARAKKWPEGCRHISPIGVLGVAGSVRS
jgi:hypothetical protein